MNPNQIEGQAVTYEWRQDRRLISCAVAVILLLNAAFGGNSEGYSTFLRIYICGLAAVLALYEWRLGRVWVPLSAVLLAILFNPIRPIEMERDDWLWYDCAAAAWFAVIGSRSLLSAHQRSAKKVAFISLVCATFAGVTIATVKYANAAADVANNTMNVDENLTVDDASSWVDVNAATNEAYASVGVTDANASTSEVPPSEQVKQADEALNAADNAVSNDTRSKVEELQRTLQRDNSAENLDAELDANVEDGEENSE